MTIITGWSRNLIMHTVNLDERRLKIFFQDWKLCNQEPVSSIQLDRDKFYYLHARAWNFKGYIGGTHSWCVFFHRRWLVVEYTDMETIQVQNAQVIYGPNDIELTERAPFITDRIYNARWFGSKPCVVDYCKAIPYSDVLDCVKSYPLTGFNLLNRNCNTFTSYLIARLDLKLKRPLRSVGFKSKNWWRKNGFIV